MTEEKTMPDSQRPYARFLIALIGAMALAAPLAGQVAGAKVDPVHDVAWQIFAPASERADDLAR